jgi:hypothetical protein
MDGLHTHTVRVRVPVQNAEKGYPLCVFIRTYVGTHSLSHDSIVHATYDVDDDETRRGWMTRAREVTGGGAAVGGAWGVGTHRRRARRRRWIDMDGTIDGEMDGMNDGMNE